MVRKTMFCCLVLFHVMNANIAPDGSFDRSFGVNGGVLVPNLGTSSAVFSVRLTSDDSILSVGTATIGLNIFQALLKLRKDGTPDTSFGTNGAVINSAITGVNLFTAGFAPELLLYSDGRILVGTANAASNIVVSRYLSDGSIDTSFGAGLGYITINIGAIDRFGGIALQSDEKIVVVGTESVSGQGFLVRLNSNGSLDTQFGINGVVTDALPALNRVFISSVEIDNLGRLLIGGYDSNAGIFRPFVARFNSDGSLDTSFGATQGYTVITGPTRFVRKTRLLANGSIVQVGLDTGGSRAFVVRYTPEGLLDSTFGQAGITNFAPAGTTAAGFFDIKIQSDGKLVVSGNITISGVINFLMARFLSDGSLDESFGANGYRATIVLPDGGILESIAIDSDNHLVACGYSFANPGQTVRNATFVRTTVDSVRSSTLSHAIWSRYYNQKNR